MDEDNVRRASASMQAMRAAKRWLLWKEIPHSSKPKPDKVPYYVSGSPRGATDTADDRAQLATFDNACAAYARGGYAGLAFALGPDEYGGHWQGIDLDEIPDDQLDQWAATLPGYVEVSPSGNGLHALGYGRYFAPLGSNGSGFEAYASGRFFTVTGATRKDDPLTCLADLVETKVAPRHAGAARAENGAGTTYVDPRTLADLRSALAFLRADDYHLWIAAGQALKELGETGRGLWIDGKRPVWAHRFLFSD